MSIAAIPEIQSLVASRGLVRIPEQTDVPITPRVRRLIDSAPFRRLSQIPQLGLVSLVYPGARHTRFEHSLGVYRLSLLYLQHLANDERFEQNVSQQDAERFILAALLHDVGHWPFCHPIEDMRLPGVPKHEHFAERFIGGEPIAQLIEDDWNVSPESILDLLAKRNKSPGDRLLQSLLSGPADIDKLDYLDRDSLHAGVPYGRHFDRQRLISSLCLNEAANGLAISEKGRTAAEMMVFARYIMFSEVYWHHAVRSATAMLQRAFFLLKDRFDFDQLFTATEADFIRAMQQNAQGEPAADLLAGLFGPTRRLYKRSLEFGAFQNQALFDELAHQPFERLVRCSESLAEVAGAELNRQIPPHYLLIDAPPVKLEVQFDVSIFFPKERVYRPLEDVSPVVSALARKQFDDVVKRVRLFVHPDLAADWKRLSNLERTVEKAVAEMKPATEG